MPFLGSGSQRKIAGMRKGPQKFQIADACPESIIKAI